jgi:hypothetical protein
LDRSISIGFSLSPEGKLVYMFQVPVANFPPQQIQQPETLPNVSVASLDTPMAANANDLDVLNPVL